jgi:acyl dehydratase
LSRIGEDLGASSWLLLEQDKIDLFSALTDDVEPLHNDPDWCRDHSPYGKPIALGFHTLSLLTRFFHEVTNDMLAGGPTREGFPLNYGFDRVRFLAPVPAGSRIRCRFRLLEAKRQPNGDLLRFQAEVEIEGVTKPALTAEWLTLWVEHGGLVATTAEGPGRPSRAPVGPALERQAGEETRRRRDPEPPEASK